MKKMKILFSAIGSCTMLFLISCNSDDYSKDTTTVTTTDTMTTVPAPVMTMDTTTATTTMTTTDTVGRATSAASAKRKGKVSTVMMTNTNKSTSMDKDEKGYYSSVEVLPLYPGGQNALDNYINSNIEYPADAADNSIEGKVTVYFAVDEMGKVSNPRILGKPLGYGLEDEVIKAVNKMPTWTPGNIKGKNVKTYYTLPVSFRLE